MLLCRCKPGLNITRPFDRFLGVGKLIVRHQLAVDAFKHGQRVRFVFGKVACRDHACHLDAQGWQGFRRAADWLGLSDFRHEGCEVLSELFPSVNDLLAALGHRHIPSLRCALRRAV